MTWSWSLLSVQWFKTMKITIKIWQVRRWHPDKFEQKLGSRIAPRQRWETKVKDFEHYIQHRTNCHTPHHCHNHKTLSSHPNLLHQGWGYGAGEKDQPGKSKSHTNCMYGMYGKKVRSASVLLVLFGYSLSVLWMPSEMGRTAWVQKAQRTNIKVKRPK